MDFVKNKSISMEKRRKYVDQAVRHKSRVLGQFSFHAVGVNEENIQRNMINTKRGVRVFP